LKEEVMRDKTRILIVEDEVLIAHQLRRKLDGLGYEVIAIVTNGLDALRIAADETPDLVLMDIVIQGDMDGIETADILIKDHHIPVIYLTAYAERHPAPRRGHARLWLHPQALQRARGARHDQDDPEPLRA
jgi:CheY-like chemotaxis protein